MYHVPAMHRRRCCSHARIPFSNPLAVPAVNRRLVPASKQRHFFSLFNGFMHAGCCIAIRVVLLHRLEAMCGARAPRTRQGFGTVTLGVAAAFTVSSGWTCRARLWSAQAPASPRPGLPTSLSSPFTSSTTRITARLGFHLASLHR
ncbi:hypothetical protein BCR44DRAFT_1216257 [Catenaria anguillulae PL171]|uniref:Uncharacterized protein n=1 Tax=Catenaria anguillulae PL171 TaxID=765915 RepID=A0A1Y2HYW9_9FUNG|nr:hypothetical protein BCR44DRAFT_1216257 [Catenaria anguillulae PL171]